MPAAIQYPKVIGITGKKHAGKDTTADYLIATYGFARLAFADPVKEALAAMFGVPVSIFHDSSLKETPLPELLGFTPRFLMTTLGTEWGRNIVSRSIWTDLLHRKATALLSENRSVVVTDVRYDNEAEVVRSLGGTIWRVVREGGAQYVTDTHSSEDGISDKFVDHTLHNNRDFNMLYAQIGVGIAHIDRRIA